MNRLFRTIILCAMLYAVVSPSVATANECASSQVVYARRAASIREEPEIRAETVRYAKLGERFEVISSTRANVTCWLQTSEGWLIDNPVLVSANPPGETSTRSACTPAAMAYITGAMNIRASASTTSSVVAHAGAGDSFNVLESRAGATWCWLRVSEGWFADTRRVQWTRPVLGVATSPEVPPAPQPDIDNCCFVDRQCTTDKEWEAGYWAYQDKQCSAPAAPAVSNIVAQQQQTTAAPSEVNNCCFVDRQCTTDKEWEAGYWAYQDKQCSAPAAPAVSNIVAQQQQTTVAPSEVNNCCHIGWDCQTEDEWIHGYKTYQSDQCENPGVVVIGSEAFKAAIFDALQHLKSRSAYWYAYTVDGLDNIRGDPGTRISVTSRSADVTWGVESGYSIGRDLGAIAATLVHEACHVHRRRAGLQSGGLVGERDCLQKEIQVLDVLGSSPGTRNWLQDILDNINNRSYQWWH